VVHAGQPEDKVVSKTAEERQVTYYDMSTRLAHADNAQLVEWLGEPATREWGSNTTIKLGRTRVFVKRIPVTAIEHVNLFSTRWSDTRFLYQV
jgi:hypothetical protein